MLKKSNFLAVIYRNGKFVCLKTHPYDKKRRMCCRRKPILQLIKQINSTAYDSKKTNTIIGTFFCEDVPTPNGRPSECPLRANRCVDAKWYRIMTEQCPMYVLGLFGALLNGIF